MAQLAVVTPPSFNLPRTEAELRHSIPELPPLLRLRAISELEPTLRSLEEDRTRLSKEFLKDKREADEEGILQRLNFANWVRRTRTESNTKSAHVKIGAAIDKFLGTHDPEYEELRAERETVNTYIGIADSLQIYPENDFTTARGRNQIAQIVALGSSLLNRFENRDQLLKLLEETYNGDRIDPHKANLVARVIVERLEQHKKDLTAQMSLRSLALRQSCTRFSDIRERSKFAATPIWPQAYQALNSYNDAQKALETWKPIAEKYEYENLFWPQITAAEAILEVGAQAFCDDKFEAAKDAFEKIHGLVALAKRDEKGRDLDEFSTPYELEQLGDSYLKEGRKEEALACYSQVVALGLTEAPPKGMYVVVARDGEGNGITDSYESFRMRIGRCLIQLDRCEEARPYFEDVLVSDGTSTSASFYLGLISFNTDKKPEAWARFEHAFRSQRNWKRLNDPIVCDIMEILSTELGKKKEWKEILQKVCSDESAPEVPLLELGKIHLSAGDFQDAQLYLERAQSIRASTPGLQLALGEMYLKVHNPQKALYHLQVCHGAKFENPRFYSLLGEAFQGLSNVPSALYWFRKAGESSSDPEFLVDLSTHCEALEAWDEAEQLLSRAMIVGEYPSEEWMRLGSLRERNSKYQEALDAYRQAKGATTEYVPIALRVGDQLAQDDSNARTVYLQGVAICEEQLKSDFNNARLINYYGVLLDRVERHAEARKQYERAVALNPDLAVAWNNLGLSEADAGNFEIADQHFSRALQLDPERESFKGNAEWASQMLAKKASERAAKSLPAPDTILAVAQAEPLLERKSEVEQPKAKEEPKRNAAEARRACAA